MKKHLKAFDLLVLAIIGLVVTIAGTGISMAVFPNWEDHADIELTFRKNDTEKISSYEACNSDELIAIQTEGSSSCKYTIYSQTRGSSNYKTVKSNLTFSNNNEWNGSTYSLSSSWWNDIRFKVKKNAGTSVKSTIVLSLGKSTD